jgi:hypothetical protein
MVYYMDAISCGRDQLIALATFSANDVAIIKQRRHHHTQLGFGYQLAYVRVFNRFPTQQPLEVIDDILTFVALQLKLADSAITRYEKRQPTISEHQETIRHYMGLSLFNSDAIGVDTFVLNEA